MYNPFKTKKSVKRLYRSLSNNPYSYRFFEDLSTSFSFILGENDKTKDFFAFEPKGCIAETILNATTHYNLNYKLEQTISSTMHSLLSYGQAYIYLQPQYTQEKSEENKNIPVKQTISSLDIGEVKGVIKQRIGNKYVFYTYGFNGNIIETELMADGLISLNIRELGYRKKHFLHLCKKIRKCDVTSVGLLSFENTDGYDFNIHLKKKRLKFLKKTKSIGWSFGNDGLSDSYILYRKILQDKFRIKALNFIIDKINEGLSTCLHNESPGKLVAHIRNLNYDDIWEQYTNGKITVTELTNLLYKNQ